MVFLDDFSQLLFLFQGSCARASAGHDDGLMVDSLGHSNHSEEAELESLVTG